MAKEGWRVRVAVRRPNEAIVCQAIWCCGQVEPVLCNIRDDASVAKALRGADAVINCVGILARDVGVIHLMAVQNRWCRTDSADCGG